MPRDTPLRGTLFALAAAALNGSIGVFSKALFAHGVAPAWIACLKTLIGCVALSAVLWVGRAEAFSPRDQLRIGGAAFFGIFLLFFFETKAYQAMSAAAVVVVLMGTSAVTASLAAWALLGARPRARQWLGTALTVAGIAAMLGFDGGLSVAGALQSALAGAGYGLFTVLIKRHRLPGGLRLTRQLLLWGALYLALPASLQPLDLDALCHPAVALSLLGLATLPSILGFYCTTRAVDALPPERVQLLELSEPAFAALMVWLFLGERLTATTLLGGALSALGIWIGATAGRPADQPRG